MKNTKVVKTIHIYNQEGFVIKTKDVSNLTWVQIYFTAALMLNTSMQGVRWEIIVKPKE